MNRKFTKYPSNYVKASVEDNLTIDDMRDYIDAEWENCGCGEAGMSRDEAEVYLGHPVDDMTQEEIDEEVSEIQKAYYTSGDIAGASDQEVIDKYNEMTGANRGYVKASKKSKNSRDREIYEYLDECGGYIGYDDKIDSLVEDFGLSREDAEGYVWNHASGLDRLNGLR